MNRGEWVVTVLGLAGTFLLPWPGEGTAFETKAVESGLRAPAAACRATGSLAVPHTAVREARTVATGSGRS